ncbi:MAG: molybdopterin molybdotransferase MoeA, partial [Candidatus Omnitrophica bacterium]|nr:molybdopterin molybdotransferase MoeA [Candidatus Omnitrophota bacterium]
MKTFVSYKEAGDIIARAIKPLTSQEVDLLSALNCVLAQDVVSQIDLPVCDNSAMDGYAVRHQDIQAANIADPVKLKIIGSVFAGQTTRVILKNNQAIRIMTGAAIPKGADTVVPVEQTQEKNGLVFIRQTFARGTNARFMGEDIRKDELVLKKGFLLRSGEIALLAALGYAKLKVIKTPQVAILATGDELVGLNEKLRPGKIRNSNSYSLAAAVMESQAKPVLLGIAKDDFQALKAKIKQGLAYDML